MLQTFGINLDLWQSDWTRMGMWTGHVFWMQSCGVLKEKNDQQIEICNFLWNRQQLRAHIILSSFLQDHNTPAQELKQRQKKGAVIQRPVSMTSSWPKHGMPATAAHSHRRRNQRPSSQPNRNMHPWSYCSRCRRSGSQICSWRRIARTRTLRVVCGTIRDGRDDQNKNVIHEIAAGWIPTCDPRKENHYSFQVLSVEKPKM